MLNSGLLFGLGTPLRFPHHPHPRPCGRGRPAPAVAAAQPVPGRAEPDPGGLPRRGGRVAPRQAPHRRATAPSPAGPHPSALQHAGRPKMGSPTPPPPGVVGVGVAGAGAVPTGPAWPHSFMGGYFQAGGLPPATRSSLPYASITSRGADTQRLAPPSKCTSFANEQMLVCGLERNVCHSRKVVCRFSTEILTYFHIRGSEAEY